LREKRSLARMLLLALAVGITLFAVDVRDFANRRRERP
jgi:hypothetical protein